jgi:hypothetical protein
VECKEFSNSAILRESKIKECKKKLSERETKRWEREKDRE